METEIIKFKNFLKKKKIECFKEKMNASLKNLYHSRLSRNISGYRPDQTNTTALKTLVAAALHPPAVYFSTW